MLAAEFADLSMKLPVDLRSGADSIDPAEPEQIRARLEDAKALLLERLLREGHHR
jgi:hypothetical protein